MLLKKKISWSTITYANKSEEVTPINNNKIVGFFLKDLEIDGGIRKAFTVFGNKKLHKSSEKLKSVDQIVAGSMMMADGRPLEFSHSYNDLVSIHYPETANSLEKSKDLSKVQCGFWATGQTVWATDGCVTVFDDVNGVSCSCNHLTDFSVLLDISGSENAQDPQLEKHNKILSTISLIGLSVSIVSLSFVIFTALLYKLVAF
ncbi:adhesion G protein-coupled receptor E3-like [Watersipora subatra]|uniref:adhesion G protein-coupled receptor E3-like n=1 Tax=Watersipora subatra TaxID=2589382 RepID=UPI00355BF96F